MCSHLVNYRSGASERGWGHHMSSSPAHCSGHIVLLSLQDHANPAHSHLRTSGFLHDWLRSFFSSQLHEGGTLTVLFSAESLAPTIVPATK